MITIRWRQWAIWAAATVATTTLLLTVRDRLDKAHVALLYLLLVLAGSVAGGRRLGLGLALVSFLSFNWFFLEPYNTLAIADPLDWLVLVTFLVVGAVAAQIVHRLKEEADAKGAKRFAPYLRLYLAGNPVDRKQVESLKTIGVRIFE